jgi:hypothetical protein
MFLLYTIFAHGHLSPLMATPSYGLLCPIAVCHEIHLAVCRVPVMHTYYAKPYVTSAFHTTKDHTCHFFVLLRTPNLMTDYGLLCPIAVCHEIHLVVCRVLVMHTHSANPHVASAFHTTKDHTCHFFVLLRTPNLMTDYGLLCPTAVRHKIHLFVCRVFVIQTHFMKPDVTSAFHDTQGHTYHFFVLLRTTNLMSTSLLAYGRLMCCCSVVPCFYVTETFMLT